MRAWARQKMRTPSALAAAALVALVVVVLRRAPAHAPVTSPPSPPIAHPHPYPRKTAIVHIGPHKTGSSYFQRQLCAHSAELESFGYRLAVCPDCHKCTPKHFYGLGVTLANRTADTQLMASSFSCSNDAVACFQRSLALDERSVIISSEALDGLAPPHAARLAALLAGYDVRVALFHRAKMSHILSFYSHYNRIMARPDTMREFLAQVTALDRRPDTPGPTPWPDGAELRRWRPRKPADGLQLARLVAMYGAQFGADNVHVLSHDGVAASGGNVFLAFAERVLRVPAAAIAAPQEPRENESGSPLELAVEAHLLRRVQERHATDITKFMVKCAAPAAARLARVLPLACGLERDDVAAWEREEMNFIRDSGAQLHYFVPAAERGTGRNATEACDLDLDAIERDGDRWWGAMDEEAAHAITACVRVRQ
jgi:hypothetical protein